MGYTTVPDRAIGYALAETDWDVSIKDNLNTAAWVVLASSTLNAAAANFDLTSISGSFAHLRIVAYLRTTVLFGGVDNLHMRFNGDTGANYDYQEFRGNNTTVSAFENFAGSNITFGFVPTASSSSGNFGAYTITIPHYANSSNNKVAICSAAPKHSNALGSMLDSSVAGFWRSNAAINRVTITPLTGNWEVGSSVTLLGLP